MEWQRSLGNESLSLVELLLLQNGIEVVVGWYVEMVETKEFFYLRFQIKNSKPRRILVMLLQFETYFLFSITFLYVILLFKLILVQQEGNRRVRLKTKEETRNLRMKNAPQRLTDRTEMKCHHDD